MMDAAVKHSEQLIEFAEKVRKQFPILTQQVNGNDLVYFDNAATTQKPQSVIDAISEYYKTYNSNVHRGVHHLSQKATTAGEDVRRKVAKFIGAHREEEIIFTTGTTASINLVSAVLSQSMLKPGDEILITEMEHHSNIVPWQLACERSGAVLKVAQVNDIGELDMDNFRTLLSKRTKVVSMVHVSNSLGTINPVKEAIDLAHEVGALTLIDGAQAVAHTPLNMAEMGCDFYAFSGHKMYGPTGIGVLYGKYELLASLPPYQGGGEMIDHVTFEHTTYNTLPFKYEAGTPNIAGIIGLGAAIDWMKKTGLNELAKYEKELLEYAEAALSTLEGYSPLGTATKKSNIIAFNLDGIHHYDLGVLLDKMGIALRTGHHCTQPLMERCGISGTVRVSLVAYNTFKEVDALIKGIRKAQKMLS